MTPAECEQCGKAAVLVSMDIGDQRRQVCIPCAQRFVECGEQAPPASSSFSPMVDEALRVRDFFASASPLYRLAQVVADLAGMCGVVQEERDRQRDGKIRVEVSKVRLEMAQMAARQIKANGGPPAALSLADFVLSQL